MDDADLDCPRGFIEQDEEVTIAVRSLPDRAAVGRSPCNELWTLCVGGFGAGVNLPCRVRTRCRAARGQIYAKSNHNQDCRLTADSHERKKNVKTVDDWPDSLSILGLGEWSFDDAEEWSKDHHSSAPWGTSVNECYASCALTKRLTLVSFASIVAAQSWSSAAVPGSAAALPLKFRSAPYSMMSLSVGYPNDG